MMMSAAVYSALGDIGSGVLTAQGGATAERGGANAGAAGAGVFMPAP